MEWVGTPEVVGSSPTIQYVLVTVAIAGLQFVWSIEQAYFDIYLLDLGMTKSGLSIMWLAGPLCGLIVQPAVGVASDFSRSRHGRRRPFMIWGSICVAAGLLAFAWAREISSWTGLKPVTIAIGSVLFVDVAVNTSQACSRALIVDMFGGEYQAEANGWAGRMASVGHLVSYYLGSIDLTVLGFESQMKAAGVLYSAVLLICMAISSTAVKERVLVRCREAPDSFMKELVLIVKTLWNTSTTLDAALKSIFRVQLLAWYAWFTFLFFGSTYASEVWQANQTDPVSTGDMARAGSLALAVFSMSSTFFTFVLPRLPARMTKIWMWSFLVYAFAVTMTHWVSTYTIVLVIFAFVGFSWASTLWIPYALTSERIHELPNMPYTSNDPEDQPSTHSDPVMHVVNESEVSDSHNERSGIILGIHNSSLTIPQFISTFGSYVIFQLLDTDPQHPHDDGGKAIAATLQVGAFTALLAAFYTTKVKQN